MLGVSAKSTNWNPLFVGLLVRLASTVVGNPLMVSLASSSTVIGLLAPPPLSR
jgi:hypothetical protein